MRNVNYLELQYGEADWRAEVVTPSERFVKGTIAVPDRSGFGVELNEEVLRARSLPL
jgi:galactonate dehydratase